MIDALPEIVLLPGLDGTGALFERLQRCLPATDVKVTVVAYPADPDFKYRDYAAFVGKCLGTRSVVLLGESFSGPIAVMAAAANPHQVRGLILSATFLQSPWPGWLVRLGSHFDPCSAPRALRNGFLMGRYGDRDLASRISDIVASMPTGVRAARMQAVSTVDVRAEFAGLRCPILVLHDAADWIVPKRQLETAVKTKTNARIAMMPGAHMLLQTRPDWAAQQILTFIRSLNR